MSYRDLAQNLDTWNDFEEDGIQGVFCDYCARELGEDYGVRLDDEGGEFIICMDCDAEMEPRADHWWR